jgi:hypothetical protein
MAKRDLGDVAVTALTRPGVGSALLAALGVYLVLVVQSILSTIAFVVTDVAYGQDALGYLSLIVPASLPVTLGAPLPFAIGVWLAFWQIAPVAPQLRMAHVVTRALLAAVVGAVVAFVVAVLVGIVVNIAGTDPALMSGIDLSRIGANVLDAVRGALSPALSILIQGLVVVPLAALLLWGRLQTHPPKAAPAGALDEV